MNLLYTVLRISTSLLHLLHLTGLYHSWAGLYITVTFVTHGLVYHSWAGLYTTVTFVTCYSWSQFVTCRPLAWAERRSGVGGLSVFG